MSKTPPKGKKTLAGSPLTPEEPKGFRERVVAEAGKQGLKMSKPGSIKAAAEAESARQKIEGRTLFSKGGKEESPIPPATIRHGHMAANYVRPHYDKDDKDVRVVGLEFSFPLTDDHRGRIPRNVERSWKYLLESGETGVKLSSENTRPQTIYVRLDPDPKNQEDAALQLLHVVNARIRNAVLSMTESKGTGKKTKAVRYSFQVMAPVSDLICKFADNQYGNQLWLHMADTEPKLIKD